MVDKLEQFIQKDFDEPSMRKQYEDKDLIFYSFNHGDLIKKVPKAKDKIDVLWIYGIDIYKLEGGDLATIRDQLLSVPCGVKPYNNHIILGGWAYYTYGMFCFYTCSPKAFNFRIRK